MVIPEKKGLFVGNRNLIIECNGCVLHYSFVSAMELALMGGWSTIDKQVCSRAFEFILKGSGRYRGRLRPFFLPEI